MYQALDQFILYFTPVLMTVALIFCLQRTCVENGQLKFNLKQSCHKLGICQSFIAGIPMMVLPACQYGVGCDYWSYVDIYQSGEFGKEIVWGLINNIFIKFDFSPQSIFIFSSIIMIELYVYAICENSKIPEMSVLLFFFVGYYVFHVFGILREGIAVAIMFYSYVYVKKRDLIKFLICNLVAFGFHYTAILAMPLYWIYSFKFSYYKLCIFSLFIFLFKSYIGELLVSVMKLTYYGHYVGGEHDAGKVTTLGLAIPMVIIILGLIFSSDIWEFRILMTIAFITLNMMFFSEYIPAFGRVVVYYRIYFLLLLPFIANNIKTFFLRYSYICCVLACYCSLYLKNFIIMTLERPWGAALLTEYQTFFGMY